MTGRDLRSRASMHRVLAMLTVLFALTMPALACAASTPPSAGPGDRLTPGRAVSVDLDGDGDDETVGIEGLGTLVIDDGKVTYRSRAQWTVIDAWLGDTDGNGLLEVTTLLDDSDGRHLGLFAWMGGRYRERIVTAVLVPTPVALQVIPVGGAETGPDLVLLTEDPGKQKPANTAAGSPAATKTLYRWNGFGFTAIDIRRP